MRSLTAYALDAFPLIGSGDDVARIIVETAGRNGLIIEEGDVVVATQKIFSKAERRVVRLRDVVPSEKAVKTAEVAGKNPKFVELILKETKRVLKTSRELLLVEDNRGIVCINAGIDKSNIKGRDSYALLPENPDESARRCRSEIKELTGKNVAVVICDTYSRPFRRGQVNFAIGMAGINPFRDYRGKQDLFGQTLKVKNVAIVDELAAAGELLMGQAAEATPVVILRGLGDTLDLCEKPNSKELSISNEEDLFRGAL
jgi:coenzyme F420-0:L-glutamate ligase/coenzyme F420-1:gamma-L-glutamate ligase